MTTINFRIQTQVPDVEARWRSTGPEESVAADGTATWTVVPQDEHSAAVGYTVTVTGPDYVPPAPPDPPEPEAASTLYANVTAAIDASDDFDLTTFGEPVIGTFAPTPAVVVYAGRQRFADRMRPVVEVYVVLGMTEQASIFDGQTAEANVSRMVDLLLDAPGCLPDLLPTSIDYAYPLVPGSRKTYIVEIIRVIGV